MYTLAKSRTLPLSQHPHHRHSILIILILLAPVTITIHPLSSPPLLLLPPPPSPSPSIRPHGALRRDSVSRRPSFPRVVRAASVRSSRSNTLVFAAQTFGQEVEAGDDARDLDKKGGREGGRVR